MESESDLIDLTRTEEANIAGPSSHEHSRATRADMNEGGTERGNGDESGHGVGTMELDGGAGQREPSTNTHQERVTPTSDRDADAVVFRQERATFAGETGGRSRGGHDRRAPSPTVAVAGGCSGLAGRKLLEPCLLLRWILGGFSFLYASFLGSRTKFGGGHAQAPRPATSWTAWCLV